jgi:hypothetical protein
MEAGDKPIPVMSNVANPDHFVSDPDPDPTVTSKYFTSMN